MNDLDVTNVNTDTLNKIIKTMALSRYLNVSVLATKVKAGIEKTFENTGGLTIHVTDEVYDYTPATETPDKYNGKITTWNGDDITITLINASTSLDDKVGEVDNVMEAIRQLQGINSDDISNIVPGHKYSVAMASALKLGNFLDQCGTTIMLQDVPGDIFTALNALISYMGSSIPYNKANTADGYCYGLLNDFITDNAMYYLP